MLIKIERIFNGVVIEMLSRCRDDIDVEFVIVKIVKIVEIVKDYFES